MDGVFLIYFINIIVVSWIQWKCIFMRSKKPHYIYLNIPEGT